MKKQTTIFQSEPYNKDKSQETDENFQTFSQFIQSSSELNRLIESHLKEISITNNKFSLIGLHSCGNLSNSIVNLYVNSNRDIDKTSGCKLLCNVACCYNLLNEKYVTNDDFDEKYESDSLDESSKFPMSKHLNKIKYYLSYDFCRLACHSFERLLSLCDDVREVNLTQPN